MFINRNTIWRAILFQILLKIFYCLSTLFEGQHYFGGQRNSGEYGVGMISIIHLLKVGLIVLF